MGTLLILLPILLVLVLLLLLLFLLKPTFLRLPHRPELRPDSPHRETLIPFRGGEALTIHAILDAPGEVVSQSGCGTLYKAQLGSGSTAVMRFLRPECVGGAEEEVVEVVRGLGGVRHCNLVPVLGLYVGPRGEMLILCPFYGEGSLHGLLRDGNVKLYRWELIHVLSLGIVRGLYHLHNVLQKPIIHGNLKSKNILLDANLQPCLSDFGMHLLLNPTAAQEMVERSGSQGYKAPELIKMKDANKETDVYSLGVIFLEMLTRKEPTMTNLSSSWELHLPTSVRNVALERKLPEIFSPELLSPDKDKKSFVEPRLLRYLQLAMSCCSPSPSLRPDIKEILRQLEEIGRCS